MKMQICLDTFALEHIYSHDATISNTCTRSHNFTITCLVIGHSIDIGTYKILQFHNYLLHYGPVSPLERILINALTEGALFDMHVEFHPGSYADWLNEPRHIHYYYGYCN